MGSKDNVADSNVPKQVLAFCFVKVLPKDADDIHTIQEAVRLFEENDQLQLHISEKIREKAIERERLHSRVKDLKNNYLYRHNQRTAWKIDVLNHLHLAQDNFSVANKPHRGRAIRSCTTEQELNNKKLNYMMLHGSRSLTEEKKLLRNKNMCQNTDDPSSSPLLGIMKSMSLPSCDKLRKEIKLYEVTRKKSAQLKESIRNQVKIICDELMEMRKKRKAFETKIKHVNKQIDVINEEIWSFQKDLKDRNCRKDASLFVLMGMKSEYYWVLHYGNLENESIYTHTIELDKCTPQERRRRNKERLKAFCHMFYC